MTKRIFMMRVRTRPVFVDFSWHTTRWLVIVGGSCSVQQNWSIIAYLAHLFIFFVLMERNFSVGTCIRQV